MPMFHKKTLPATTVEGLGEVPDPILLDVREPDEWAAGHAPDAWFWPLGQLESVRFELPMNRTIVCVCRSGVRSATAVDQLRTWGLRTLNLEGGMQAWAAAGKPVVTDEGGPGQVI